MFDLFLCHHSADKGTVRAIAARLLDEFSIRCWLDEWDLQAGKDWDAAIQDALRQCRACAIFLGPSGWGDAHLREARTAVALAQGDPQFLVIPVRLPEFAGNAMVALGDFYERVHRIDVASAHDDDGVRSLALAVRGEAQGPPVITFFTIRRDAERWDGSGQESSLLYRGAELRDAQRIAVETDLGAKASRFLAASAEEERRIIAGERRRGRRVIAGLLTLATALAGAAILALTQTWSAREEAYGARAEAQIASTRNLIAQKQRAAAESQRRQTERQTERATAANMAEVAHSLYSEDPIAGLRLMVEAAVRLPAEDPQLAARVDAALREMTRSARLARIATSAQEPIPVADTAFFVLNERDRSTLRRRGDGGIVAVLPDNVTRTESDNYRPEGERSPFFIIDYGYFREARRKRDGTVASKLNVKEIIPTGTPFALIHSNGGEAELRHADKPRVVIRLPQGNNEAKSVAGTQFFIIQNVQRRVEIRSARTGEVLTSIAGEIPREDPIESSRDGRVYALSFYTRRSDQSFGRNLALFDRGGRHLQPDRELRSVAFSTTSSRYAIVDAQGNGELRFTDLDEVRKLGPSATNVAFIGDALLVRYANDVVEVYRGDRSVLRVEGVTDALPVPGTDVVLMRCRATGVEMLRVSTGQRTPIDTSGSPINNFRPQGTSLRYFVLAHPYEIRAVADGSRVLTAKEVGVSPESPWLLAVTAEGVELFDLRDGRRIPLGAEVEKTPRHWEAVSGPAGSRHSPLYSWPDIPIMVIGTVPAQIRRVHDGRLLATLPGRLEGLLQFTPDRRLVFLPFTTATSPARNESAFYDTSRGTQRVLISDGRPRDFGYTYRGTFAYLDRFGMRKVRYVCDLRSGKSIGYLRGGQVDDQTGWFAVLHEDDRAELWYDVGASTPLSPVSRLPDRAVLVASDDTGKRLIVWEPGGAVLLVAGDIVLDHYRKPPVTRADVVRVACRILAESTSGLPSMSRFEFGERFRACAD